ncbi:MAG TPA: hypothetical protein VKT51_06010 [Candidatus Eremiobacteraceae bacterium]|nr:hypothetical protein [Candidatus Eremiobacteraceae bacterium]
MTASSTRSSGLIGWPLALLVIAVCAGVWLLLNPQNFLTGFFRAKITDLDTRVVTGPYPSADDFAVLRANGVETDVSLLDADLPYEAMLLEQERVNAAKYGMAFVNFPMESIFGTHAGSDYDRQAHLAAEFIARSKGRIYLHCYLGMHRVRTVAALLTKEGTPSAPYLLKSGARSADARLLDEAQADYDAGRYTLDRKALAGIKSPTIPARLLAAWTSYRLDEIALARGQFAAIVKADSSQPGAFEGLGYCALRSGELETAAALFMDSTRLAPKDAAGFTGLGFARFRQGRTAEAKAALVQALALNPQDSEARTTLARIP